MRTALMFAALLTPEAVVAAPKALACDITLRTQMQVSATAPLEDKTVQVTRIYFIDDEEQTLKLYDKNTGGIIVFCKNCNVSYGPKKIVNSYIEFEDGWFREYGQSFDRVTGAYEMHRRAENVSSGFKSDDRENGTCEPTAMPVAPKAKF